MASQRIKKIGQGAARALLFLLTALSLFTVTGVFTVTQSLLKKQVWVNSMSDEACLSALQTSVNQAVEEECLLYGLEDNLSVLLLDQETIKTYFSSSISRLYEAIFEGKAYRETAFPPVLFRSRLDTWFSSLGGDGNSMDEETLQEMATVLSGAATDALTIFHAPTLVSYAQKARLADRVGWLSRSLLPLGVLSLLLGLLCVWWGDRDRVVACQKLAGLVWCAITPWFIPFTLFRLLHLPEKLALDGIAQHMAQAVLRTFSQRMGGILTILFLLASLLLVSTTLFRARRETAALASCKVHETEKAVPGETSPHSIGDPSATPADPAKKE